MAVCVYIDGCKLKWGPPAPDCKRRNSMETSEKKVNVKSQEYEMAAPAQRRLQNFTLRKRNQSIFKAEKPRRFC